MISHSTSARPAQRPADLVLLADWAVKHRVGSVLAFLWLDIRELRNGIAQPTLDFGALGSMHGRRAKETTNAAKKI